MYIPTAFDVSDPERLRDFMRRHSFATLVSQAGEPPNDEPLASHLPLLLDADSDSDAGPRGRLVGHMARANPHWQAAAGRRVLVIFHGPHAYVSPGWVEAKNVVPTWNYVVVHAYGTLRLIEDRDRLRDIVRRTTDTYEAPHAEPWSVAAPDAEFLEKLLGAIVGFEIDLDRIEGKWKLSQNHPAERREQIVRGLESTGRHDERLVADLMRDISPTPPR